MKMVANKELIEKLKIFGLNSYEAKIWTALLSRGVSTAGELSDIANVPRSRAYDVLESLEKKGFIVQKIGKPIKYMALPPEEVIERLKKRIKKEAEEREKLLEKVKETELFEELRIMHSEGIEVIDPAEIANSLRERQSFIEQAAMMIKEAQSSIYMLFTQDTLINALPRLRQYLIDAHKKKVDIRILVVAKNGEDLSYIENYIGKYAKIGFIDNIEARFMTVDDKEVLFFLLHEQDTHEMFDPAIWVSSPLLAGTLSKFFQYAWALTEKKVKIKKK